MLLWQATVNIECLCALICDCGVAPTKLMHIFSQARLCATPDVSQTRARSTMAGPPSQRHLRHSEQLPAQARKMSRRAAAQELTGRRQTEWIGSTRIQRTG